MTLNETIAALQEIKDANPELGEYKLILECEDTDVVVDDDWIAITELKEIYI